MKIRENNQNLHKNKILDIEDYDNERVYERSIIDMSDDEESEYQYYVYEIDENIDENDNDADDLTEVEYYEISNDTKENSKKKVSKLIDMVGLAKSKMKWKKCLKNVKNKTNLN